MHALREHSIVMNEKRPSVLQSLGKARTDGLLDFFGKEFCFTVFACGRKGKAIALCSVPLFQFGTDAVVFCFGQNIFFL